MVISSAAGDDVHNESVKSLGQKGFESTELDGSHAVVNENSTVAGQNAGSAESESGKTDRKHSPAKASTNSKMRKRNVSSKITGRRYSLRSSMDGVQALRYSQNKTLVEPTTTTSNTVKERRKRRSKDNKTPKDDYSIVRQRIRYLLNRMRYEQSLIDAYSAEGWKGQNLEKLRPEKELERAKSEILRRKLETRNIFHHLDSLLAEGRLPESLFDLEGQISSEDILCARCGSKELSAHNDIILCDGVCVRGFHQKCLNPPLKTEDIPPGDEGWLCPGCVCKLDCIVLLNEFQGSHLKVKDKWEKVFPEAEAIANGEKQCTESGPPSEDSEDDDYNPEVAGGDTEDEEKSSSGDSDFTSTSEDLGDLKSEMHQDILGLPSDDSEDDDFDPDKVDAADRTPKDESSSDESDFTSDSDEFCVELSKSLAVNNGLVGPPEDGGRVQEASISHIPLPLLDADSNLGNDLLVSRKRQIERLDYKKLNQEEYGNELSDSSDDEDWSSMGNSRNQKKDTRSMATTMVEKWFENARCNLRHSSQAAEHTPVQSSSHVEQVALTFQGAAYTQSAFMMACSKDDVAQVDTVSTQTQDTNRNIPGSGKKRKSLGQSIASEQSGSGAGIDEGRKKAIARELRRRRLSR